MAPPVVKQYTTWFATNKYPIGPATTLAQVVIPVPISVDVPETIPQGAPPVTYAAPSAKGV
jgi:hypothetical protein